MESIERLTNKLSLRVEGGSDICIPRTNQFNSGSGALRAREARALLCGRHTTVRGDGPCRDAVSALPLRTPSALRAHLRAARLRVIVRTLVASFEISQLLV